MDIICQLNVYCLNTNTREESKIKAGIVYDKTEGRIPDIIGNE